MNAAFFVATPTTTCLNRLPNWKIPNATRCLYKFNHLAYFGILEIFSDFFLTAKFYIVWVHLTAKISGFYVCFLYLSQWLIYTFIRFNHPPLFISVRTVWLGFPNGLFPLAWSSMRTSCPLQVPICTSVAMFFVIPVILVSRFLWKPHPRIISTWILNRRFLTNSSILHLNARKTHWARCNS